MKGGFLCHFQDPLIISQRSLQSWKGSCVLIPCEIRRTYDGQKLKDLYLVWYFGAIYVKTDYIGTTLYKSNMTSNDQTTPIIPHFQHRVQFVGDLNERNCSLKISQLQKNDTGRYGARLYGPAADPKAKWFLNATVTVEESPPLPKMETFIHRSYFQRTQVFEEQKKAKVDCSVTYHCLDQPLQLTFQGLEEDHLASQKMTFQNRMIKTVLVFVPTWEDHGKTLKCSLNNQDGSEVSQGSMPLNVKHAPKGVKLKAISGTTVQEGMELSLECIFNSSYPAVHEHNWYKDHQPIQYYSNKIEFDPVSRHHSGSYKCQPVNGIGSSQSEELNIDVQYPPENTEVQQVPQRKITEGNSVTLRCFSQGNPPIQNYTWYKDNELLFIEQKEVLFSKIKARNSGTYYCEAQNLIGTSKSAPVTLDVHYAPKNVQLALDNRWPIKERDTITLNCSVGSSNPSYCTYKWYKKDGAGKERLLDPNKQLVAFGAPREKASIYRCEACNYIQCTTSAPVTVNVLFAPNEVKIVQEPEGLINEGAIVRLKCEVGAANPDQLTYAWYKDKTQVVSTEDMLNIQEATANNSGNYHCEAKNTVGNSRSSTIKLIVQFGPRNFKLSLNPKDAIIEGNDVYLKCNNDAFPAADMYMWYWNRELMPQENSEILVLQEVQVEHSGDYSCKASNVVSEGESPPTAVIVYYSRSTVLKRTAFGFSIALALVILLGLLLLAWRRWKVIDPGTGRTERATSFFVKKPKGEKLCNKNNQLNEGGTEDSVAFLNHGADGAISYATIQFPPRVTEDPTIYARIKQTSPRPGLDSSDDAVIYSVVKKPPSKGDTKADYENVVEKKEEELHYSSLVNLTPRPRPTYVDSETDSESEESIQYASLKH
ncbi:B-cell receptor CD22-like [Elgaria multicarinata webbii]|uniref:B-cell receptor CD22-like n=1 Tax=Elgaria multicarinata webbii TaxID=159646 RepID=UPI002FCD3148